jgi:hypothetical protein
MHQRLLIVLCAMALALSFTGNAAAGCGGNCDHNYYYYSQFYEQPEVIVRRPSVVLKPYNVTEYIPCGDGVVVNQGQYRTKAALIVQLSCFHDDVPVKYRN